MRTNGRFSSSRSGALLLLLGLTLGGAIESKGATTYPVGSVVTNFTLYLRRAWTNHSGRVFSAGAPVQLSDFSGSILFVEFFDPT